MRGIFVFVFSGLLLTSPIFVVRAAEPDPAAILKSVRLNAVMQEHVLRGTLTKDGRRTPFTLDLRGTNMAFSFEDPAKTIVLNLGEDQHRLTRIVGDQSQRVEGDALGAVVLGTDITYEDLGLRFLYWEDAEILQEERFRGRDSWKIRVNNPRREGPYAVAFVWVDKEAGGLLGVQGYNWEGQCIKRFEVVSGMRVDGAWMLQEMRVETLDGTAQNRVLGRTYLHLDRKSLERDDLPDW